MDKPEFCWFDKNDIGMLAFFYHDCAVLGAPKFRITYNEAGEVIRLERVEE